MCYMRQFTTQSSVYTHVWRLQRDGWSPPLIGWLILAIETPHSKSTGCKTCAVESRIGADIVRPYEFHALPATPEPRCIQT